MAAALMQRCRMQAWTVLSNRLVTIDILAGKAPRLPHAAGKQYTPPHLGHGGQPCSTVVTTLVERSVPAVLFGLSLT